MECRYSAKGTEGMVSNGILDGSGDKGMRELIVELVLGLIGRPGGEPGLTSSGGRRDAS